MTRAGSALTLAAVLGTIWLATPGGALAYCRMTTSRTRPTPENPCPDDGIPLAWRRRCASYSIDARGSPDLPLSTVRSIAETSFATWQAVTCDGTPVDFEVRETAELATCVDAEYRRKHGNVSVIAFVNDWAERDNDPSAFALTTVWHNTRNGEIYDVDIQLNQSLGPFGDCPRTGCPDGPSGDPEEVDLQNVLTHEIGHFFGLGHTRDANACMYALSPRGETTKRVLRTDDVTGFCAVYPPGSLPAECDFTPRGGLDLNCEDGRGCSVARGPGGEPAGAALAITVLALVWRRRPGR